MAGLTPAQKIKLADIMKDPVKWAQVFLITYDAQQGKKVPWTARWYQKEMLRDGSKKRVYRCGRRTGKCLTEDDVIIDYKTGERVTVKELYKKRKANLVTLTEDYKLTGNFTNEIKDNGIKEVFRVTTKTGRSIDATGNHPLFTGRGWEEIDSLHVGDKVALPSHLNFWGNEHIPDKEIKLLAYMIGDGNCTNKTIRFSANNDYPKIKKEMESICSYYKCELKQYDYNKSCDYNIVKASNADNKSVKNNIKEILINHDIYGKSAKEKSIPSIIFRSNRHSAALFLSRLYATDGWVYIDPDTSRHEIGYCSSSTTLAKDVQHLLLKLGINSFLKEKKVKYNDSYVITYQVMIYNAKDTNSFIREIGIYGKEEKVKQLYKITKDAKEVKYLPKEILESVEEDRIKQNLSKKDLCKNKNERFRLCYDVEKDKLRHYGKVLKNDDILDFAHGEFIFDEIVSIESLGEKRTYDFSIPQTFNFVVNDFITHNTETMVVDALYNVYTKANFRVLIVTPYETQVRLAFMRLNELIDESPLVKDKVKSATKNPYKIEFNNNSAILGFTTGASSGGGAASIRGQRADLIVMDEVDYMSEADFDSVMIIAGERNDIRTVMSSTPTGKRGKFYQACTNPKMGFTEHYHPSTHNPGWCAEMEGEFRATLSEQGYVHEVEAEFGVQNTGVFNKEKIDLMCQYFDYAYDELNYYQEDARIKNELPEPNFLRYDIYNPAPPTLFRTIGVDWDKYGASSSILVLEYNLQLRKFMVLKRYEVPRAKYSYDEAVKKVIELDAIYNPQFIYCDRGAGEYQIEALHIYGESHPETNLANKVIGKQFSEKLKMLDPVTGEETVKPLKPFMVTQLQIAFERENLLLSKYDEVLYKQLVDYEVKADKDGKPTIGANGNPIFTSKNEHFVDALGLAYLAMVIEFPELTGTIKNFEVSSVVETSHKKLINHDGYVDSIVRSGSNTPEVEEFYKNYQKDENPDEQQRWVKTDFSGRFNGNKDYRSSSWGTRDGGLGGWNR